jgi:hypothetical protein
MLWLFAVIGTMSLGVVPSHAEETTTVVTEHHDDGPGVVVTAPARAAGAVVDSVVGDRPADCTHETVTKTDGATGDTIKKSRTDC